ncbi:MAG: flagellar export protein FliJ [Oscillospiraceae bacterium]|jgi:flagellar export protein FliJ
MKRFVFSLQPLLKLKRINEKQKKTELAEIQNRLNELYAEKEELERRLEESSIGYKKEMRKGMPPPRMAWYANFADYLQAHLKALNASICEAERIKEAKQSELVTLMKEIKTIEKLREEQYRAYLEEAAKDEERVLGDLISYNKSVEKTG